MSNKFKLAPSGISYVSLPVVRRSAEPTPHNYHAAAFVAACLLFALLWAMIAGTNPLAWGTGAAVWYVISVRWLAWRVSQWHARNRHIMAETFNPEARR